MRMNLPAGAGSTRAQVSRHLSVIIISPTGMGSIAVPRERVCLQDGLRLDQPSPADARLDPGGGSVEEIRQPNNRTPLIRRFFIPISNRRHLPSAHRGRAKWCDFRQAPFAGRVERNVGEFWAVSQFKLRHYRILKGFYTMPDESKDKGGRPPFKPTKGQREDVVLLVSCGTSEEVIAGVLGISRPTLREHFEFELTNGGASFRLELRAPRRNVDGFLCQSNQPSAGQSSTALPAARRRHELAELAPKRHAHVLTSSRLPAGARRTCAFVSSGTNPRPQPRGGGGPPGGMGETRPPQ
jgi:hypothetical protein